MIRVLICDEQLLVRQGIRQMLCDAAGIGVGGEAANGRDALVRARDGGIDVVMMDIDMPDRDGLDVLRQLKSELPRLPVLMLSTRPDKQYAVRSMKLGAVGYIDKSADAEQMADAVRKVAAGALFITPAVAGQSRAAVGAGRLEDAPLHDQLSHREYQVFRLLSHGRSMSEIAQQLSLAPNTVSAHRARILEKADMRNGMKPAPWAVHQGLLQA